MENTLFFLYVRRLFLCKFIFGGIVRDRLQISFLILCEFKQIN